MKQIFQLDGHDLDQLKKGHIYDIVLNGVTYGLSYHREGKRVFKNPKAREEKKVEKEKKEYKMTLSPYQLTQVENNVVPSKSGSNAWVCRKCNQGGFKNKQGARMHYMSAHIKGWRKGGRP